MFNRILHRFHGFRSCFCRHNEDAACRSMTPALVGGPVAHSSDLLTMRYLAAANFELTYRNQVILLSTFYEHPEIVNLPDVKRADYIFMGHEDFDHDAQVAPVVKQTGALLYGNQNVINHAVADGVPAAKTRLLKSGDVVQFDGFTVEAVMMCHSGSNAPEGPYGPSCYQRPALQYYGQAAEGINLGGTMLCNLRHNTKVRDVQTNPGLSVHFWQRLSLTLL